MAITDDVMKKISTEKDRNGGDLAAAVQEALAWIKTEKLEAEVLAEMGPRMLASFWVNENHKHRDDTIANASVAYVPPPPPGQRRIDYSVSLLDIEYPVGPNHWKKLGDLTKADCLAVARRYRVQARTMVALERVFKTIARRLRGVETVRERFKTEELARLFKNVETKS